MLETIFLGNEQFSTCFFDVNTSDGVTAASFDARATFHGYCYLIATPSTAVHFGACYSDRAAMRRIEETTRSAYKRFARLSQGLRKAIPARERLMGITFAVASSPRRIQWQNIIDPKSPPDFVRKFVDRKHLYVTAPNAAKHVIHEFGLRAASSGVVLSVLEHTPLTAGIARKLNKAARWERVAREACRIGYPLDSGDQSRESTS